MKNQQKNRCIRLSDEEWETFKEELGMQWLRTKIKATSKRVQRKAASHE